MSLGTRSAGRFVGIAAAMLCLGITAETVSVSRAEGNDAKQVTVARINVVGAELGAAVKLLTAQTGAEIVLKESDKPYGRVNLSLENKPLDAVLKLMCYAAGASLRQEGGVYIIGPKEDVKEPAKAEAEPGATTAPAAEAAVAPPARSTMVKVFVRNMRPSALAKLLGRDQGGVNRLDDEATGTVSMDPERHLRGFNASAAGPRTLPADDAGISPGASPRGNARRTPPAAPVQENGVAPRVGEVFGGTEERQYGGGYGGGQFGGGQFGGGQFGGGQFGGGRLGGGRLGGGQLGGEGGAIGQGGVGTQGGIFPDLQILAFDADNSIIIRGNEDQVDELRDLIRMLDVPVKQLMIKAEFVTVNETEIRSFGINWSVARGALVLNAPHFAVGEIAVNYATGNVVAQMLTSLSEDKNRILNAPMVTTMNNVPVGIQFAQYYPILTNATTFGQGGNVFQNGTSVQLITIASGLQVLPRINSDDTITLNITPYIQSLGQLVTDPQSGNTYPIVNSQSVNVNRRVKNGDMIVIAGLQTKNTINTGRKIPLLGDLPLIGSLFRSVNRTTSGQDILIFVTASILPDPVTGEAGGGSVGSIAPR